MFMVIVKLTTDDCVTYIPVLAPESRYKGDKIKERKVKKNTPKTTAANKKLSLSHRCLNSALLSAASM